MKKTKIVCTLGPASKNLEIIKNMINEGMNVARINFSHGGYQEQKEYIDLVKKAREELNVPIALLLDTQGPEIRIGRIENDMTILQDGAVIILTSKDILGNSKRISISYSELYKDIEIENRILVDDGAIELRVEEINDREIYCRVIHGGELSSRKSINIPNAHINLPALREKDIQDLKDGCKVGFDFISASFVRRKEDILAIREVLDKNGGEKIKIIAKIENQEGLDNFNEIIEISDGIMIARGDLGVEVPLEEVPIIQKRMIKECNRKGKYVITATQMLESMTNNSTPTRAEVSDVANAIYDITGAIMLSGESAKGKYPVECVKTMTRIANSIEGNMQYWSKFKRREYDFDKFNYEFKMNHMICVTAMEMKVKAIIAYTDTGSTPIVISSFLPECPIYAITSNEETYRQLSLCWNTYPILIKEDVIPNELISLGVEKLKKEGILKGGDMTVVAGGPTVKLGNENIMNKTIGGVIKI